MSEQKLIKTCLVISYGPVPTPEYQTVEGGGMRAWGLAKGLQANGIDATIAINSGFPLTLHEHDDIQLLNWSLDADFIKTINSYDAVIVSYCMGDVSVFVADNIRDDVQLILDAYVPIYIEVSARDAKDMDVEYVNYMADLRRHNHTLMRGDYFLYANPAQEQLYTGVLSALGIINPYSYHTDRLIYAPFGIHREDIATSENPYRNLDINDSDFTVLWFGGIYPWFRIEEYLEAIKQLSKNKKIKFVFVGGKNPFNANEDIARQYTKAVEFAHSNNLFESSMYFVDWVDFDTRANWFRNADVIVSLNQPGKENIYSWRTRVMDFVWGEAATITNGGDPLSEEMIENDAAIKLESLSSQAIVQTLQDLQSTPKRLDIIRANVRKLKDKYYWDTTTRVIRDIINESDHPFVREIKLRELAGLNVSSSQSGLLPPQSKLRKIAMLPIKAIRKARKKGLRNTSIVALNLIKTQVRQRLSTNHKPQFIFISHPIDNTGAPIVLLQVIEEYVTKYGASRVRVIAPGATKNQENHLKSLGVTIEKAINGVGFHFIRLQLGLRPNDFVFMNTVAIYDTYRDFILLWLKLGRLKHAYWFIHEDKEQLPIINPEFLNSENVNRIKSLVSNGHLSLLYPSKRTSEEYSDVFGVDGTTIKLRVDIPEQYKKAREIKDFDKINILLSGTSKDGRKGQLLALSALQYFIDNYYKPNPDNYRPVMLQLVAVANDDYISKQVRWIARSITPEFVTIHDILPKEDAMKISSQCNVVMCCSLNETFGLYIAEGMLMGQIVLRNNSAGSDEQLIEGVNGFGIDHTDIHSIAAAIEKLANKSKLSNTELANLGKESLHLMEDYTSHTYLSQIR